MAESTPIAVIISTRNRSEWLRRSLFSLSRAADNSALTIRLIYRVGIQGEDQASADVLKELQTLLPELEFHRFPIHFTPAKIRNVLVKNCGTENASWLLFVDDDAFVPETYFDEFRTAILEQPEASAVGGPNLTPPGSGQIQRATGVALSSRFGSYLSKSRYAPAGTLRRTLEHELILCNLFVRREHFPEEGFPENFYCGEENLFLHRMRGRGNLLIYCPKLFVWHERRPALCNLFIQVFSYGRSRSRNILREPTMFHPAHITPTLALLAALTALFLSLYSETSLHLLLLLLMFYLVLALVSSLRGLLREKQPLALLPQVLMSFLVIHLAYATGFFFGFGKGASTSE